MSIGKIPGITPINRDTPLATERAERGSSRAPRDPRLDDVAKLYEKQFLREMVRAMRGTVSHSEITKPTMAEEIYRGQLDEQYVESWGDQGGIGLSDLIYEELSNKILNQSGRGTRADGPKGPIALTDRDVARVHKLPTEQPRQSPLRIEIKQDPSGGPARVQSPWDGRILTRTKVDGRSTVLIEHAGGVRSALIFDGVPSALENGAVVKRGDTVGTLGPDIRSFFWNLSGAQPSVQPSDQFGVQFGGDRAIFSGSDKGT